MSGMRVCFVAPRAYPVLARRHDVPVAGGAELQQAIVARELARRGYDVSMVSLDFGQQSRVEVDGVKVLAVPPARARGLPGLRWVHPRLTDLIRVAVGANADIYYQRSSGAYTACAALAARCRRARFVYAAASDDDLNVSPGSRIPTRRDRWLYRAGLRAADRILVQNVFQLRRAERHGRHRVLLVPNCFPAVGLASPVEADAVLWVGTIKPGKRPEIVLALARRLPQVRFRIIGGAAEGGQAYCEAIRERAAALPNVEFMGFMGFEKADAEFDRAVCLLNTSAVEGFPNTFLQAWARGVPTVSFVAPSADGDDSPGIVCADMAAMSSALHRLSSDPDRRRAIGERCRERHRRLHSTEAVAEQYEAVFRELARRP